MKPPPEFKTFGDILDFLESRNSIEEVNDFIERYQKDKRVTG